MKSKATGCGSISTVFSNIVLLCVSTIIIIVIILIIIIIIIIKTTANDDNDNNNDKSFQKLLVPGWVRKVSALILKNAVMCHA